jgi:hypothetical protein
LVIAVNLIPHCPPQSNFIAAILDED